jgi:hypothetical protein
VVNKALWLSALAGSLVLARADAATYPQIDFEPESPRFVAAAEEYRAIWRAEGERISTALERATLVHELAHRLISPITPRRFDDHPIIFLFVYDVWVQLWGKEFADAQVAVESQRTGRYDYAGAWRDALALGADGRKQRWSQFLAERTRRQARSAQTTKGTLTLQ